MKPILLNPGPVSLSEAVRQAAVSQDLCHRETEYFDLQDRIRNALCAVYSLDSARWSAVLLGGSGTSAIEAMLATLVARNDRLLVLENGVYGERLTQLARVHELQHEPVPHDWLSGWNLEAVDRALAAGRFSHVAAVHHETTTGRLNEVAGLASICEAHGVHLLLDGVSSFGAEAIPFDSPALVACAATANKCLHGIPGACFVLVRRDALGSAQQPPRSLTLDLRLWSQHQDRRSTPFTPAVNAWLALAAALGELEQAGGWSARRARYRTLAAAVASQLEELGVRPVLNAGEASCVLRSYRLPGNRSYAEVHDALKLWGFVIYGGQGPLAANLFRIATMGDITDYDLGRLLVALQSVFATD